MKIGVLSYENMPLALDGRDWQNIGDYVQSYAMIQILEEMHLTDTIEMISRFDLTTYDGDYILLMMNSFNILTKQLHFPIIVHPISNKIIPCYISYHLPSTLSPNIANFLRQNGPIGCRDEYTMNNMRKNNIQAYLSGCITALLPRCAKVPKLSEGGKILFIDTPESLEPYIPKNFSGYIEKFSSVYRIERTTGNNHLSTEEFKEIWNYMINRFEYYKDHASLIVTSRLHVASPCMAMGIPIILTIDNIDERYAWIDKFLPIYSKNNYKDIDWNPIPIEYEEEKKFIKNTIKKEIKKKWIETKDIYTLSSFYEQRKKVTISGTIKNYLENIPIDHKKQIQYVIWGTVKNAQVVKRAIDEYFPHWTMTHAIDLNCEGTFEGITIEKPDIIDSIKEEVIYIVVPASAYESVSTLLNKKGKKYILIDYTQCKWSDNINERNI